MKWGEHVVERLYFVGIGGIGMSGLARYAKQLGLDVAGYDKTQTALTAQLEDEGIPIGFDNDTRHFNQWFDPEKDKTTGVVKKVTKQLTPLETFVKMISNPFYDRVRELVKGVGEV